MNNQVEQAAAYFKQQKAYEPLMKSFRKKYESLGRVGGSLLLSSFTDEQLDVFSLFLAVNPDTLRKKGSLSITDFEKRLQQTKFRGIDWKNLLEAYFEEEIVSKRIQKEQLHEQEEVILCRYERCYPSLRPWLSYIKTRPADSLWVIRKIREEISESMIEKVALALGNLPGQVERLPHFSQRITGDPHAFDLHTKLGTLFLHILQVQKTGSGGLPSHTEGINELLYSFQLLRDDLHSFVTMANISAWMGDQEHPVWKAARETRTVLNVPLRETVHITAAAPFEEDQVFIVENSGVFSMILDEVPDAPLLCTHGQFKLAAWRLLDMLQEADTKFFYSGDFDPEGLAMASRLVERYPAHAHPWRLSSSDYKESNPTVKLGDRKFKVDVMHGSSLLQETASVIKSNGKIGYQEGILSLLIEDVKMRNLNKNRELK